MFWKIAIFLPASSQEKAQTQLASSPIPCRLQCNDLWSHLDLDLLFRFDTPRHRLYLQAISENVQQFLIYLIIYFLVVLLLGAVIGAIGGLIGRRRA
jgi:hypothetical protein